MTPYQYYMAKMQEQIIVAIELRYGLVLPTPKLVSNVFNKHVSGYQKTSGTNVAMPNTSYMSGAVPFKKILTQKELEEKRANHMCFYYDEKYFPSHKCSGQLHSLEVVIEENEDAREEVFEECTTELFTHDSPSDFARDSIFPLKVDVADGNSLNSSFMSKDLIWTLQGLPFVTDMMVIYLGGCEMVLGSKVLLRGTPQSSIQWMQGKGGSKKGSEAMLNSMSLCVYPPTLFVMEKSEHNIAKHPCKAMEDLLAEYDDVFSMPNTLPPKRQLNKHIVKDKFPIPMIKELIDEVQGSVAFSKLDLRPRYHQIRMRDDDIHKTPFRTHDGHFEFLVMPFGLTNDPFTFQSLMNTMFKPFLRRFTLVFFDDILIYSRSEIEHLHHLEWHVISAKGVSTDKSKIQAIKDWPIPKTVKQLRGFLGLTSLPDFKKEFIVETNACDTRIRVVLQQEGHHIAYLSKALSPKHQVYSTYKKEFWAMILALEKWRGYLMDIHFKIKIDHFRLKYLLDQRVTTPFQAKWLPKLLGFDYEISYKGSENVVADDLSRVPSYGETLKKLIEKLKGKKNNDTKYTWSNGQLRRKGKLMVGNIDHLRKQLFLHFHAGESTVEAVDRSMMAREQVLSMLKFYLKRAQDRMLKECKGYINTIGELPTCDSDGQLTTVPVIGKKDEHVKIISRSTNLWISYLRGTAKTLNRRPHYLFDSVRQRKWMSRSASTYRSARKMVNQWLKIVVWVVGQTGSGSECVGAKTTDLELRPLTATTTIATHQHRNIPPPPPPPFTATTYHHTYYHHHFSTTPFTHHRRHPPPPPPTTTTIATSTILPPQQRLGSGGCSGVWLCDGGVLVAPDRDYTYHYTFKYLSIIDNDVYPEQKSSYTFPPLLRSFRNIDKDYFTCGNSLLCFWGYADISYFAVFWNPSVGKFVSIKIPNGLQVTDFIGFGFCSDTFDPKLVRIKISYDTHRWDVDIFTLSSRAWKRLYTGHTPVSDQCGVTLYHVCIKGCIY
ncbi:putative mitochondrial protein [Tanacetum coccineum]